MPDYRAAVLENGREIDVRVGYTFDEVARWAEELMHATGADEVRVKQIGREDSNE